MVSNRIKRLQRWQRRWFVLFDDGELTYALDEQVSFLLGLLLPNSTDRAASEASMDVRSRLFLTSRWMIRISAGYDPSSVDRHAHRNRSRLSR